MESKHLVGWDCRTVVLIYPGYILRQFQTRNPQSSSPTAAKTRCIYWFGFLLLPQNTDQKQPREGKGLFHLSSQSIKGGAFLMIWGGAAGGRDDALEKRWGWMPEAGLVWRGGPVSGAGPVVASRERVLESRQLNVPDNSLSHVITDCRRRSCSSFSPSSLMLPLTAELSEAHSVPGTPKASLVSKEPWTHVSFLCCLETQDLRYSSETAAGQSDGGGRGLRLWFFFKPWGCLSLCLH